MHRNNTEGMTYKSNGTNPDRAVAIDGNDVISIALGGQSHTTLFNVLGLDPLARAPRGLVWNPADQHFIVSSKFPAAATQFFVTDETGAAAPTLQLTGLANSEDWLAWEGLAYVPSDAPFHPGSIVGLGLRNSDSGSHLFYVDPQTGEVQDDIALAAGTPVDAFLCGVSYWPQHPGTLLVSDCGASGVYQVDMRFGFLLGSQTDPLVTLPEAGDIESIVVRSNGQLYLNGYETGHLYAYDTGLNRAPGFDREFLIGLGISADRLSWNYDTGELVVSTAGSRNVYAVAKNLRTGRFLFGANNEIAGAVGLSYLGGNRMAIGANGGRPGIDVVDMTTGLSLSRLVLTDIAIRGVGLNGTSTWLVSSTDLSSFRVFTRTGTPDTTFFPDGLIPVELDPLPLSTPRTSGRDVQLFDSGQGLRVFTGGQIYDLDGNLVHAVDAAAIGITDSIGSGTFIGGKTFAVVDGQTSTVIEFTIP